MSPAEPFPIPLPHLNADDAYQPRRSGLSESHIRLLMEVGPDHWPPLLVSPADNDTYDVIDGFHRLEAARRLGLAALPCTIAAGAGYPEAVAANIAHGLPLTKADRADAARWWHETEPGVSYREIGRRVGLSDKTVKRAVGEVPVESRRPASPDPIRRLVALAYRAYGDHAGRTWFGFGEEGNPDVFRREIAAYAEADQADVARALTAFGTACVTAAAGFLPSGKDV